MADGTDTTRLAHLREKRAESTRTAVSDTQLLLKLHRLEKHLMKRKDKAGLEIIHKIVKWIG